MEPEETAVVGRVGKIGDSKSKAIPVTGRGGL
jgi:hypothetical protein